MKGKFITIEGTEGVGKTTNIAYIKERLETSHKKVLITREPGGTPTGERIRALLLDPEVRMDSDCELLMMFAARANHLSELITPALEQGTWVLCDRFTDATYAYQGGGRQIDPERISALEDWVQGSLRPDITLILDVPVELGLARASNRSAPDRFEREQQVFFERVRAVYLDRAKASPARYRVIDASGTLVEVQQQLERTLDEILD